MSGRSVLVRVVPALGVSPYWRAWSCPVTPSPGSSTLYLSLRCKCADPRTVLGGVEAAEAVRE